MKTVITNSEIQLWENEELLGKIVFELSSNTLSILHTYAYQLLAEVLLMLCAFHRTCCDAGIIQRRKLLATGLGAAFCCMAALAGDFQAGFFLASGLWAVGCMCDPSVLPPDPEEETPGEDAGISGPSEDPQ